MSETERARGENADSLPKPPAQEWLAKYEARHGSADSLPDVCPTCGSEVLCPDSWHDERFDAARAVGVTQPSDARGAIEDPYGCPAVAEHGGHEMLSHPNQGYDRCIICGWILSRARGVDRNRALADSLPDYPSDFGDDADGFLHVAWDHNRALADALRSLIKAFDEWCGGEQPLLPRRVARAIEPARVALADWESSQ